MCHGANKSASPISALRRLKREDLSMAIREGIKGIAMRGFSIENSGPLNEDDIASLIKVIKP
jgi:mono/diheme cytochrome c family protein